MAERPMAGSESDAPADPRSPRIHEWLQSFVRGLKGLRMYAGNNETLQRYLEDVELKFEGLFEDIDEFSLSVREDRLLHRGDVVWVDGDRMEGLPFTLFRNAFRRLTFERAMSAEELRALMAAIIADYSRFDAGEDLVTALWRLQLPHLRYITIDTLTVASRRAATDEEREEIERLQADVESIVALVYQSDAPSEDIVSGLSISQEDLEALKDVRAESPEDLEQLDQATERAVVDIPPEQLADFAVVVGDEAHEQLMGRSMDVLVRLLFTDRSSREALTSLEMLQQLMDKLLVDHRFGLATELVRRLRDAAEDARDLQKLHIARQLIRLLSSENRLVPLVVELNDRVAARSVSELVALLRALGEPAVPAIMNALSQVEAPLHRRILRDLVIELGVPDVETLESAIAELAGTVVRDILVIAAHRPPGEISELVSRSLTHEHPRVREQATKMLRAYSAGQADDLLRRRLDDADAEVRQTALRVAVARRCRPCAQRIRSLLSAPDVADREMKELRQMTQALVAIEGESAAESLARWLNPGLLAALKNSDLQVVSALALGLIKTETAQAALVKGSRALNPKVREACRRALERQERADSAGATETLDPSMDIGNESGDYVPISNATFETSRSARAVGASGPIPEATTPVEEGRLPPAPPPEMATQVIERSRLTADVPPDSELETQALEQLDPDAILGPIEESLPHAELTDDLQTDRMRSDDVHSDDLQTDRMLTEEERDALPPGSVSQYVPDIDVVVPGPDRERTPTPSGSGSRGGRS